ncbi:hypothetical protein CLV59_11311 [Chitinophaga dinghuensis]|uniref:Lipoprotein n=1 Tax=Chitinophaga dinghuensis TaxID=1539050 RepID=A0A327VKR2_9BACT|nr:hypothetical protein [Chitinophaga dinghuensis]RAJ73459.1 hypothetical protein CLV59_11311 [Chitinophaga dinghuensis]
MKYSLILLGLLLAGACNNFSHPLSNRDSANMEKAQSANDSMHLYSKEEIIDPIIPQPFILSLKRRMLKLPDSLCQNGKTGSFVVEISINRSAVIVQHRIILVRIYSDRQQIKNYFLGEGREGDSLVKRFCPYIADCVKDNILLKPNPEREDQDSLAVMNVVMRFN